MHMQLLHLYMKFQEPAHDPSEEELLDQAANVMVEKN